MKWEPLWLHRWQLWYGVDKVRELPATSMYLLGTRPPYTARYKQVPMYLDQRVGRPN